MYAEVPVPYRAPTCVTETAESHRKWLHVLKKAEKLVQEDADMQIRVANGLHLKERNLAPETIGRFYARYCGLVNALYDCYLRNVHLQRATYILEILTILMKRLFELRNELVNILLSSYIYIDTALIQTYKTPLDIEIVIPYHIAKRSRDDSMETLLRQMWHAAVKRRNKPPAKDDKSYGGLFESSGGLSETTSKSREVEIDGEEVEEEQETDDDEDDALEHKMPVEEDLTYFKIVLIQRHERLRVVRMGNNIRKYLHRITYTPEEIASLELRTAAAAIINKVYKRYMYLKREIFKDYKRDLLYNITSDPVKKRLSYNEESNKLYEFNNKIRNKLESKLLQAIEKERARLILIRKDNVIEDITEHIQEWFKEWYYGYGFFPEFPHKYEGGTVLVIRGDFITVEEKIEKDEQEMRETKGKTPDQIKNEKKLAKQEAEAKALEDAEKAKKDAKDLFKQRFDPRTDPGYLPVLSKSTDPLLEALKKYRSAWSVIDKMPENTENIFGYIKNVITEDLMHEMHIECRGIVDEIIKQDLKLLNKAQQKMFERVHWKFPKPKVRKVKKPKAPPKSFEVNAGLVMSQLAPLFDVEGSVTKPTVRFKDVYGDRNYVAYDQIVKDPDAKFPTPAYGDVKNRLILSCIFGSGVEPGADRRKAVMLLGPQHSGKSFMVDAVAGEMNAVKINISPEYYANSTLNAHSLCTLALLAARVFQPCVIFFKDVERVFAKKVNHEEAGPKGNTYKKPLAKLVKGIIPTEKVIFIATCSLPKSANTRAMMSLFNEVILIPRADYGTVERFFSEKFLKNNSIPYSHPVQAYVNLLRGYPFGTVMRLYNQIMTAERIAKLNITALTPFEFLEIIMDEKLKPISDEEQKEYEKIALKTTPLYNRRADYEIINENRAIAIANILNKKVVKSTSAIDGPEELPPQR